MEEVQYLLTRMIRDPVSVRMPRRLLRQPSALLISCPMWNSDCSTRSGCEEIPKAADHF